MGHRFSSEASELAQRLSAGLADEEEAAKLWQACDRNGNGILDRTEAQALFQLVTDGAVKALEEEQAKSPSREVQKLATKIAALKESRNDDKQIDKFLNDFDLNKDGKVTKEEFIKKATASSRMYFQGVDNDGNKCGLSASCHSQGECLQSVYDKYIFNVVEISRKEDIVAFESSGHPGLYIGIGPKEEQAAAEGQTMQIYSAVLRAPASQEDTSHHFEMIIDKDNAHIFGAEAPTGYHHRIHSVGKPGHWLSHTNGKVTVRELNKSLAFSGAWLLSSEDIEVDQQAAKKQKTG